MKIAEQFGIKDEVLRKGVLATGGNDAAEKVAEGQGRTSPSSLISDIHAKDAKLVGPPARGDPALDGLCRGDPVEQHRAGPRPRLHRRTDRARDAGALAEGRLAAS